MTQNPIIVKPGPPGKGRGVFATTDIPFGTRILAEKALLRTENDEISEIMHQYGRLNIIVARFPQQQTYNDLPSFLPHHVDMSHATVHEENILGIYLANSFNEGEGLGGAAVYDLGSKFNHS